MKYATILFFAFTIYSSAEMRVYQQTDKTEASVLWTEYVSGTNKTFYVNDNLEPWQIDRLTVVQPAGATNVLKLTVYHFFDYAEDIVGEVTVTNAFGLAETYIDSTVTNRSWRVMTNNILSATQTTATATYDVYVTPFMYGGVYVSGDDMVELQHSYEDGFYFRIQGKK